MPTSLMLGVTSLPPIGTCYTWWGYNEWDVKVEKVRFMPSAWLLFYLIARRRFHSWCDDQIIRKKLQANNISLAWNYVVARLVVKEIEMGLHHVGYACWVCQTCKRNKDEGTECRTWVLAFPFQTAQLYSGHEAIFISLLSSHLVHVCVWVVMLQRIDFDRWSYLHFYSLTLHYALFSFATLP